MNTGSSLELQPPRRITVVDSIIEQIVSLIRDGTLLPGDRLPAERKLMEMLDVSRSSVREALQGLVAMGLIEQRPGQGTFVRTPKPRIGLDMDIATLSGALQQEMRHHLNQARLLLELEIVVLAAQKATAEDREAIFRALETYETHGPSVSAEKGWTVHDELHLTIAEATGNPILVQLLRNLLRLVPDSLREKGFRQGTPETVAGRISEELRNHRGLCEAVINGDVSAAHEWMRRHGENETRVIDEYYAAQRSYSVLG